MTTRKLPSWTVTPADAGIRLDTFLAAGSRLQSRSRATSALQRGKVFVNGAAADSGTGSTRLSAGDVVSLWMDRPGTAARRLGAFTSGTLRIVHEDDDLIVADKPPGLLTVPLDRRGSEPSLLDRIADHLRSRTRRRPLAVHRIDEDTSGLVVFARHARARAYLQDQFKRHEAERIYWTVVYGHPDPPAGTWRDSLAWDERALIQRPARAHDRAGADAIADYETLEAFADASLIEVRLHTGRRNQIRIQALLRGHMLVGERRYAAAQDARRTIQFPRQALHARRLGFRHPADGGPRTFESPLPSDMSGLIARLRRRR